jgi:hypothetical protein
VDSTRCRCVVNVSFDGATRWAQVTYDGTVVWELALHDSEAGYLRMYCFSADLRGRSGGFEHTGCAGLDLGPCLSIVVTYPVDMDGPMRERMASARRRSDGARPPAARRGAFRVGGGSHDG